MSTIVGCPFCKARLALKTSDRRVITCPKCKQEIPVALLPVDSPLDPSAHPVGRVVSTPSSNPAAQGIDLSLLSTPQSLLAANRTPQLQRRVDASSGNGASENRRQDLSPAEPVPLAVPVRAPLQSIQVPASDSASSDSSAPPGDENSLDTSGAAKGSVHATILKRKKRQRMFFFVTNSVLAVLTLCIAGALYWQVTRPSVEVAGKGPVVAGKSSGESVPTAVANPQANEMAAAAESTSDNNPFVLDSDQTDETVQQTEPSSSAATSSPATPSPVVQTPPAPPQFQFFTPKQVSEIWKTTKPNLVALEIESPTGKQKAVGLIVDSRGWIVTSHQAVKDATRIEVKSAGEPLNQVDPALDPPLVDLVRGHIAKDPSNDLAVLAINRRFVISLAEPEFADRDRMVEQVRLLAIAPPSTTNYYGVHEVHVEQRSSLEELPLATRSRIQLLEIGRPDLSWMNLQGEAEWLPGTPLVNPQGRVEAIVSLSQGQQQGLAISLAPLRNLLKQASGEILPLRLNLAQAGDSKTAAAGDHPASQARLSLETSAENCRRFGWLPQSQEQYQLLVDFSKQYIAARELIETYDNDYRDAAETAAAYENLQDTQNKLANEIQATVQQALASDKTLIARLNQFAEPMVRKSTETLVPLFGKVVQGGLQLDQFIVKLEGLETHCVVPFDPTARSLRPGTEWFLMLETSKSSKPKVFKLGEGDTVEAYAAFQRAEFGPFRSP